MKLELEKTPVQIQVATIPNMGEWLDVWESGRKVVLFSRRFKMASSSTIAFSGTLSLLLIESGMDTKKEEKSVLSINKTSHLSINSHTLRKQKHYGSP